MGLGRAIDDALEKSGGASGTIGASADGAQAEVDVIETDKLGVRVAGVRVRRAGDHDVEETARELPDRLRALPERVEPVEVSPGLGGAILRTSPDEMQEDEFFEIGVNGPRDIDLKRYKVEGGERRPADWTMTRRQLGRLLDELE